MISRSSRSPAITSWPAISSLYKSLMFRCYFSRSAFIMVVFTASLLVMPPLLPPLPPPPTVLLFVPVIIMSFLVFMAFIPSQMPEFSP
ncbi:hypothetical protein MANES_08G059400v8 [Manihot esculenta]|uniref:Uncharacterized protein n=1 Tax=Manihot esculenta TaxID=3983 RepID=A0ACB7HAH7_MANES|nr:hypothetical protein MANES_08G059400v8 [Manihot esculenta]